MSLSRASKCPAYVFPLSFCLLSVHSLPAEHSARSLFVLRDVHHRCCLPPVPVSHDPPQTSLCRCHVARRGGVYEDAQSSQEMSSDRVSQISRRPAAATPAPMRLSDTLVSAEPVGLLMVLRRGSSIVPHLTLICTYRCCD